MCMNILDSERTQTLMMSHRHCDLYNKIIIQTYHRWRELKKKPGTSLNRNAETAMHYADTIWIRTSSEHHGVRSVDHHIQSTTNVESLTMHAFERHRTMIRTRVEKRDPLSQIKRSWWMDIPPNEHVACPRAKRSTTRSEDIRNRPEVPRTSFRTDYFS